MALRRLRSGCRSRHLRGEGIRLCRLSYVRAQRTYVLFFEDGIEDLQQIIANLRVSEDAPPQPTAQSDCEKP
ncbi:hypothetical protein AGR1B_pTi0208 [Agrobacterium fabacearum S56]|nr:hypothetical protein AGR1B_pTi0208 [Agrobacterium fabacearum S56]